MTKKIKLEYNDCKETIDVELEKRRSKWYLKSITWMDYDDVCQIIRSHIYKKWDQWDQERELEPWLNRIITNQTRNIIRNNYGNYTKPCSSCPFNQSSSVGDQKGLCGWTKSGLQDSACAHYSKWEKTKKAAYDIKLAVTIENHAHEVSSLHSGGFDVETSEKKLHDAMRKNLSKKQYEIYSMLFIESYTEEEVAKKMGYKSNEKGRKAGYKQIKNLKKSFKEKAILILNKQDIVL